jgi:hypothetical protein
MSPDVVSDALIRIVILAFVIERGLGVLFQVKKVDEWLSEGERDLKPWIAIVVSIFACYGLHLNILAAIAPEGAVLRV